MRRSKDANITLLVLTKKTFPWLQWQLKTCVCFPATPPLITLSRVWHLSLLETRNQPSLAHPSQTFSVKLYNPMIQTSLIGWSPRETLPSSRQLWFRFQRKKRLPAFSDSSSPNSNRRSPSKTSLQCFSGWKLCLEFIGPSLYRLPHLLT